MGDSLKNLLRSAVAKIKAEDSKYFSRKELFAFLPEGYSATRTRTFNRYLVDFSKEGLLYGSGRGWYSFIRQPLKEDRRPVKKIVELLKKKYPLLPFSVWSTEQLRSYSHHMLTRFVTFVHTDRDAMAGIYDFLKDAGYDVWMNPRGKESQKFSIGKCTIVLRPAISRDRAADYAGIEKRLVDLFVEAVALNLMDEDEYHRIFRNVLGTGRVDIGALLNYVIRRKLKKERFVRSIKSI